MERVIYQDSDPEVGFVLVPDLKWDQKEQQNLYVLAIARKRGVLSMRELQSEHLPMLRNILVAGKVKGWFGFLFVNSSKFVESCCIDEYEMPR